MSYFSFLKRERVVGYIKMSNEDSKDETSHVVGNLISEADQHLFDAQITTDRSL